MFSLLTCVVKWGYYGIKMYFAWKGTIGLITYSSKIAYDFSKKRTLIGGILPAIIVDDFFKLK